MTFSRAGISVPWDPGCESLLDLAEQQGLEPEFGCRLGNCHACACPLEAGDVRYVREPSERPDAGQVLVCSAVPRGDVSIGL